MKDKYLKPIHICEPPCHTQIQVRCYTCKKFPVCNIRLDYLKTAQLISNILGNPQKDYEIMPDRLKYDGYKMKNTDEIFLSLVTLQNSNKQGEFLEARYFSENLIHAIYKIDGYLVNFTFDWNSLKERYEISIGHEMYYGVQFLMSDNDSETIIDNLVVWRSKLNQCTCDVDVINTTHFRSLLECDFYEYDKNLNEKSGIQRIENIKEPYCGFSHVATYHIEPHYIQPYNYQSHQTFCPTPYIDSNKAIYKNSCECVKKREDYEKNF